MLFTVLAYMLIAALVVVGLGVLLLPVYVWVQHRDAMRAPQRALQLAESDLLLAETEAMLASPPAR